MGWRSNAPPPPPAGGGKSRGPAGGKPPASQERQKQRSVSPEKKQVRKGLKPNQQKIDSGNVSNTPSASSKTEVSQHATVGQSHGAPRGQIEVSGNGVEGSKVTPATQASIFEDTDESETEGTSPVLEPGTSVVHCGPGNVHKLADKVFKPFGSRSRTGSTADSDAAFCMGGPSVEYGAAVGNRDEALQCDRCDEWFHCACQGFPQSHTKLLVCTRPSLGCVRNAGFQSAAAHLL